MKRMVCTKVVAIMIAITSVLVSPLLSSPAASSTLETTGLHTISFVSDSTWIVFKLDPARGLPTFVGFAQAVCLNPWAPVNCPLTAVQYDYPALGWFADLSPIQGAEWIWAPNITGATPTADLNQFFFVKAFFLRGTPVSGTLYISADDFAEVFVNQHSVGTWGSVTDISAAAAGQSTLMTFDLTRYLRPGLNVIAVRGQNGPSSFAGCDGPCSYSQNPAGVVFGGSLAYLAGVSE
jgi:hypothetical protein